MTRVLVFVDYQNVYMQARAAFQLSDGPFTHGQIHPRRLALLLVNRRREFDPTRELAGVRIYRGEPSPKHSPRGQSACQRQVRYWRSQALVEVWTRPLHYYWRGNDRFGNGNWEAREKGIDVGIAVDMVLGAARDEYDVCVLCSADTDLVPALQAVRAQGKECEVAAWSSTSMRTPRLRVPGHPIWCHWLNRADYERVHDDTDYTRPQVRPPGST